MENLYEQIEVACAFIAGQTSITPTVGLILGSGLSALTDDIEQAAVLPYSDIPGFLQPSIEGHRGELAVGMLAGQPVAVLRGRLHFYEGYSMQQTTFPVRVLHGLGCRVLIVTNAAGSLHADWQVGDIMCITDQIFLPGLIGHNPLTGSNDERMGPRFPPMVGAFDTGLVRLAESAARACSVTLRSGVYIMISGPSFESSAELRMLRALGADAVGMSTAAEVVVARHAGMRVLGLSLISNLALPDGPPANHAEVYRAGIASRPQFIALLHHILAQLPPDE